ncbi:hypothetical protein DPMN_069666 [Dreissena polymorpha]|uniref:Uncharacterized protein n=1 Tax=Dreissena polymorpha TaxID=45954 RepID=A0A9D3Z415_DREPO|nr:hypothetical protein DPMN_069666 [Dreissena polymorpha]
MAAMVFQPTGIIFELVQDIIETILLTKFHEYRTINVASRVLTRENVPLPSRNVFFYIPYIIETNILTKLHDDRRTLSVASRVLTRQTFAPKNARRTTDKKPQNNKNNRSDKVS